MVKARILIAGNLERTGYRIHVKQIARNLGVKGTICILDNGLGQVYCEGEKTQLAQFRKLIEVKAQEDEPFRMHTHALNVFVEGAPGYAGMPVAAADEIIVDEEDETQEEEDEGGQNAKKAEKAAKPEKRDESRFQPPQVFGPFVIDYLEKFSSYEQEMMELQELQTLFLFNLQDEVRRVNVSLEEIRAGAEKRDRIRPRPGSQSR